MGASTPPRRPTPTDYPQDDPPLGLFGDFFVSAIQSGEESAIKTFREKVDRFFLLCVPTPGQVWPQDRYEDCARYFRDLVREAVQLDIRDSARFPRIARRIANGEIQGRARKYLGSWPPPGVRNVPGGDDFGTVDPTAIPRNLPIGVYGFVGSPGAKVPPSRTLPPGDRLPKIPRGIRGAGPVGGVIAIGSAVLEELAKEYEKWRIKNIREGGARIPEDAQKRIKALGGNRGIDREIRRATEALKIPRGPQTRRPIQRETAPQETRRSDPIIVNRAPASGKTSRAPQDVGTIEEVVVQPQRRDMPTPRVPRAPAPIPAPPKTGSITGDRILETLGKVTEGLLTRNRNTVRDFRESLAPGLAPQSDPVTVRDRDCVCEPGTKRKRAKRKKSRNRKKRICYEV